MVSMKPLPACLLLTAFVLAGCAGGGGAGDQIIPSGDVDDVEATATTGGIHGFVVDEKITPIKGADVSVSPGNKSVKSNEAGAFVINGLEPGTYFVKATHPLYDTQQQSFDVVAGEVDPEDMKFLLTRLILSNPYYTTLKFDGFIVCSTNVGVPNAGYLLSEECGEGVGVPGLGRVGGQGNNNVQFDFYVENDQAKSITVEQNWEPTSDAGKGLYSPVSLDWTCDPSCSGNTFLTLDGESPTFGYADNATVEGLELTTSTVISVFTWASPAGTTGGSVTLNQGFQEFVTISYFLPLPADWSFINGSPNPFV
jgi:hypothetical protein